MNCPRCSQALAAMETTQGPSLNFCGGCGGVWLDAGEMAEMLRLFEAEPPSEGLLPKGSEPACPSCQAVMAEIEYPPESDVWIDVCTGCAGTWLDRGELGKLRRLARTGEGKVSFIEARQDGTPRNVEPVPQTSEPDPDASSTEGPKRIIVPVLFVQPTDEGTKLHGKWVLLSTLIMLCGLAGLSLITEALVIADSVSQESDSDSSNLVTALTGLAFFLGGIMSGWKSPGHTVLEPVIAVIPSTLIFALIFPGFFSMGQIATMLGVGLVMAVVGSMLGERYAHH